VLRFLSHKAPIEDKMKNGVLVFGHIASKASWFVFVQILNNIKYVRKGLTLGKEVSLVHIGACIARFVQLVVI
jgi:hypothetical protein